MREVNTFGHVHILEIAELLQKELGGEGAPENRPGVEDELLHA